MVRLEPSMRRGRLRLASLLVAAILSAPAAAAEWTIDGQVIGVSDGDTVTLLDHARTRHKIRLHGIDAPEEGQAFGERSKQNLSELAFHRDVTAQCHKRDRYGREVSKVMLGSTDMNLEQIRAGMAGGIENTRRSNSPKIKPLTPHPSRTHR
jgi:endonuclease YncB( thermonuclease family)